MQRPSKEQELEIIQMYNSGAKIRKIYEAFPFNYSIIKKLIYSSKEINKRYTMPGLGRPRKEPNMETIPFPVPEPKLNRILVLTNFGYKSREIAEDLKISDAKVKQLVHYLKVTKKICKRV